MKRLLVLIVSAFLLATAAAPGADAAASHALIAGSGSSWAANAVNQWVADVATQGMQVVFTANGSAQGRKDYANRTTDFAVSDIGYQGADPTTNQPDNSQGRSYAYLPIAAGGTAFPYHLDVAGHAITNLRLSGETLAKIFTNKITNWDDPAITKDNNGHVVGNIPIIPVVHSEGAGTTAMFTRYLAKEFPKIWAPCNGGIDAETEYFPLNCGAARGPQRAQSGSDGVMNFIKSPDANGSIGVEEYSYALLAGFPAAKLLNSAGYYTLPTQYNVAVALTKAQINYDKSSPNYLTQNLDNVYVNPDKRAYPLSSYVYAIIPTAADDSRMTTAKRQTIADFLYYSICQGQQEIGPIGYSSLPVNLVQAGFEQIGKLKKADPGVDLTNRDVSTCHNPTFVAGHPSANYLAQVAPQPAVCDRTGAGPCTGSEGAYNASPAGRSRSVPRNANSGGTTGATGATTSAGSTGGAGTAGGTSTGGTGAAGGATSGTAGTGTSGGAGTGVAGTTGAAVNAAQTVTTTTLPAGDDQGLSIGVALLLVALLVAVIVAPALVVQRLRRRMSP